MTLRCKPGDLCVIVPNVLPSLYAPIVGCFVRVTELSKWATIAAWRYEGEYFIVYDPEGRGHYLLAIDDRNLQPIRPPTPSKTTETWAPKKQTLLTR